MRDNLEAKREGIWWLIIEGVLGSGVPFAGTGNSLLPKWQTPGFSEGTD